MRNPAIWFRSTFSPAQGQSAALLMEATSQLWIEFEFSKRSRLLCRVSAAEVIQEIQHLTLTEQAEVIQFAYRLDAERMLSSKELVALAKKMVAATDPTEALEIREQMIRGFYGGKRDT